MLHIYKEHSAVHINSLNTYYFLLIFCINILYFLLETTASNNVTVTYSDTQEITNIQETNNNQVVSLCSFINLAMRTSKCIKSILHDDLYRAPGLDIDLLIQMFYIHFYCRIT